ncbi:DNA translocase FtsK [Sutterella sp.]|uniref:DNA translocase FtsK n=1 Tax=Sutterella sp. TaxID=1981025 RepID=UPI0026DEADD7|nr:DNA translocase FtsK [Sutterella sp.]MDO5531512.1 DNA translocase FtsK 4TM domain-containing protein [Sutterella sp.]
MARKNARAKSETTKKKSAKSTQKEQVVTKEATLLAYEQEVAAAEREERRAKRRAAMNEMRERVSDMTLGLARWVWHRSWVFSVPVAGVLAASLGSYSPEDPAFSVSTARAAANLCGVFGAWTADLLYSAFGFSAWWFVLGLVMVACFALRSRWRASRGETNPDRINPPKFTSFFGLCALMVGSTSFEALRFTHINAKLPADAGGIIGDTLARASVHYVGVGVAAAVFVILIAIGLSLLMDFSWTNLAEGIGRFICDRILSRFIRKKNGDDDADALEGLEDGGGALPAPIPPPVALSQEVRIMKPEQEKNDDGAGLFPEQVVATNVSVGERPSLALLDDPELARKGTDEASIQMVSRMIVSKLQSYGINCEVKGAQPGPVITQYWLEPGPGVKGAQIENVRDDLRRALGVQSVRIVLSIPGTSYLGLEIPNPVREMVRLKEIIKSDAFETSESALTLAIGKDIAGKPFVMDLAKTPHLLVAGTTGSGKSVGINAMILSMLFRNDPSQLRLVLIDPKMLEFSLYNDIPHLLTPVVTDMNKASAALKWLTGEMDRRYAVMSKVGVRQFSSYNEKVADAIKRGEPMRDPMAAKDDPQAPTLEPWPYIVCVVDELADLMLTNRKEVEGEITRLTQKARAAGIHLILATQRPSVDVVTAIIKANVPTRIAFQVASSTDSRVILGESGAEQLLGNGDMLMHRPGQTTSVRIQGCFVADGEVQRVAEELKRLGSPVYVEGVTESSSDEEGEEAGAAGGRRAGESDPLYDKAVALVLQEKRASISFVQRHLGVGYNRAANLLEAMEKAGLVSKPTSALGKRTILVPTRD